MFPKVLLSQSDPVQPDFAGLDAVALPISAGVTSPGPDFIPATPLSFEERACATFRRSFQPTLPLLLRAAVSVVRWSDERPAVCGFAHF